MSKADHSIRVLPLRSIQEFVGGNEWSKPTFDPKEFGELQKHIVSNLIYFQSNYGAIIIPFLLLIAFFRPSAIIFGLIVIAILVAGYVYSTRQKIALPPFLHDRPIFILLLVLVTAFMIIRMFGTVFIFVIGIALPLVLIVAHATARKTSLKNKAENTAENLSLQATPMGLFLSWLGAKAEEQQQQQQQSSVPPTKRR
ncbi:unnamed protein product [Adineta steineri]|uniref:PRA1 family protein n=1 Tax=Adineta steineri TaxID=433720 RepID=A0A818MYN2_9BILA|nr:unnamed protein product [Adineta steineri]CAF1485357.1 unnamed protein product [Adineta steineri]CAF3595960.1 unnamed protein product [Adineta steineri]CAF3843316.1 unnamed protein product [Adineta steineri]